MRSLAIVVWLGVGCASTHTPREYTTSEVVAAASLLGVTALGATVVRAARSSPPPRATHNTPATPPTTRAEHLAALATWQARCDEGDSAACRAHSQRLAELAARTHIAIGPPLAAEFILIDRTDTIVTARFIKGLALYPGWLGTLGANHRLPKPFQGVFTVSLADVRIDDIAISEDGELIRFALDKEHPFPLKDVDPWEPGGHLVFMLPSR